MLLLEGPEYEANAATLLVARWVELVCDGARLRAPPTGIRFAQVSHMQYYGSICIILVAASMIYKYYIKLDSNNGHNYYYYYYHDMDISVPIRLSLPF